MKHGYAPLIAMLLLAHGAAMAQTEIIHYSWPNQVCSNMLNCASGCSACNVPDAAESTFFGTNVVWLGVDVCPYPVSVGNNAVFSGGWGLAPDPAKRVLISGISMVPMQIDSIIVRHASYSGPTRLRIRWTNDPTAPFTELADVVVTHELGTTVLTGVGTVIVPPGMIYGTFQLELSAYDGDSSGDWVLDDLRIVGTQTSGSGAVGISEIGPIGYTPHGRTFDVMGRPVNNSAAQGLYIGARRQVKVF
jgi:hypothetical protein